jgi:hypothetical protein
MVGSAGDDALVVGDGAGRLVLRDVEVDAHEHAFAGEIEVADGLSLAMGIREVREGV